MARNSPCNFWNSSAVCSGEPLNASWVAAFTNTFAGRTVSFVGDSLVRQAFLQLVCLLSAYIVDTVDTTRHRYWDCTSLECLNEFYSVQIHSPDHHLFWCVVPCGRARTPWCATRPGRRLARLAWR